MKKNARPTGCRSAELPQETEKMFHYKIYMEKKEELQNFVDKEVIIWGGYPYIPSYIQRVIDRELMAIGKYGKRINIYEMEIDFA